MVPAVVPATFQLPPGSEISTVALAATAAFAANPGDDRHEAGGAVYTMTNAATGNAVLVFDREIDGFYNDFVALVDGEAAVGALIHSTC